MRKRARWILTVLAVAVLLPIPSWVAWEGWRQHTLVAFCRDAKVGMSLTDLLRLEKRHWINDSYLVQALFKGYVDQAHSRDLEFRSHIYDPPFACAITHDGHAVTSVQLLGM
jgi:hypothetical protein